MFCIEFGTTNSCQSLSRLLVRKDHVVKAQLSLAFKSLPHKSMKGEVFFILISCFIMRKIYPEFSRH